MDDVETVRLRPNPVSSNETRRLRLDGAEGTEGTDEAELALALRTTEVGLGALGDVPLWRTGVEDT